MHKRNQEKVDTRRSFLKKSLGATLVGSGLFASANALSPSCLPLISGNLWWYHPDTYTLEEWDALLADQKRLGFNLLWLSNVASALNSNAQTAKLEELMDRCVVLGFEVILDTGFTPDWYVHRDLDRELAHCGKCIDSLAMRFARHPAFYGWYIPHEIYMTWGDFSEYIDVLYPALVKRCKAVSSAPVLVSPFFILDRAHIFGAFKFNEPDEYAAYWERLLQLSGIDVVLLQDSGEHFSYVTNAMRRPYAKT